MNVRRRALAISYIACFAVLVSMLRPAPSFAAGRTYTVTRFGDLNLLNIDITTTGVLGMSIERTYNSFDNANEGIFGNGWSAIYETYLKVQDDGSIMVHEWGGGAPNRFTPKTSSLRPQKEIFDEIVRAAGETGEFGSDADRQTYLAWLGQDDNEEDEWEHFSSLGLVKPQDPAIGATFFSGRFGAEFITRVPEGYQRETKENGQTVFEAFDKSGRLTRIWNANHDYVALSYDTKTGQLQEMVDNSGDRFTFWFKNGFVSRIEDSHGNQLIYQYSKSDLQSVNLNGKTTRYYYDSEDRLVAIKYLAGTSMQMKYNQDGLASYVQDTDGTVTTYTYTTTKTQTSETSTIEANTRDPSGKTHQKTDQYFYTYDDPSWYLSKWVDTTDGVTWSATYDHDLNELTYTTEKGTTSYAYDQLDRLTVETTPTGTVLTWSYDPATGKVATIVTTEKGSVSTEHFEYDPKGNLVHAYDTGGLDFTLSYDPYGRPASVTSGTLQLSFEYANNQTSNPTTVVLGGVGAVSISYNADGTVDSARSSGGDVVVSKVRAALQAVNNLIEDAKVRMVTLPESSS
jgi:YD repeat-containing protein